MRRRPSLCSIDSSRPKQVPPPLSQLRRLLAYCPPALPRDGPLAAITRKGCKSCCERVACCTPDEARGPKQKRPYLATECHDLVEADRWRQQIIREIGKKVMEIQNAGLGEHRSVRVLYCPAFAPSQACSRLMVLGCSQIQ